MKKKRNKFLHLALSCGIGINLIPAVQAFAQSGDATHVAPLEDEVPVEETTPKPEDQTPSATTPADPKPEGSTEPTPNEPETPSAPAQPDEPKDNPSDEPGTSDPSKPEEPTEPEEPKDEPSDGSSDRPSEPSKPSFTPSAPVVSAPVASEAKPVVKVEEPKSEKIEPTINYDANAWYHPSNIEAKGYKGNLKKALKLDDYKTSNLSDFLGNGNPFMVGQCTWFAWARFHQVYGFDSGARGNGKTNASEIVRAHRDKFELSSTPAAGATFSMEKNTLMPQYGHVGFVEAFDGEYMWISEGNVMFNGTGGNIWVHKVRWDDYKKAYPDIVFAIPKKGVFNVDEETGVQEDKEEKKERFVIKKRKTLSRVQKHAISSSTFKLEN